MKFSLPTKPRSHSHCLRLALVLFMAAFFQPTFAETKYYRYIDENGVKVINSKIPPQYVKRGYEVVTVSGEVLEVFGPAMTEEEITAKEKAAEQAEWDERLLKRYTSLEDIEAAKSRKLAEFAASMSILQGNANTISTQIDDVQGRAADIERSGRAVPEVIIDNLKDLKEELGETQRLIKLREADKVELEKRFDDDIDRFAEIQAQSNS